MRKNNPQAQKIVVLYCLYMEQKTKKKQRKKAPAKAVATKAPAHVPPNLCVNCAPLGYTQVLAMLLVSVFSLVTVLSVATYKMNRQATQIQNQAVQLQSLQK